MVPIRFMFGVVSILSLRSIGYISLGASHDFSNLFKRSRYRRQAPAVIPNGVNAIQTAGTNFLSGVQKSFQTGYSTLNGAAQQLQGYQVVPNAYQVVPNAVNSVAQGYQGVFPTGYNAVNTAAQGYPGAYQAGYNALNTAAQGYQGNYPTGSTVVSYANQGLPPYQTGAPYGQGYQGGYQLGSNGYNSLAQGYQGANLTGSVQRYQGNYPPGSTVISYARQGYQPKGANATGYQGSYPYGSNIYQPYQTGTTYGQGYQGTYPPGSTLVGFTQQGYQPYQTGTTYGQGYQVAYPGSNSQQGYQPYQFGAAYGPGYQQSYQSRVYAPPISNINANYYSQSPYQQTYQAPGYYGSSSSAFLSNQQAGCNVNEVPCPQNYCFDRTCTNIEVKSSQNGKCRCAPRYIRLMRERRCVLPRDPLCLQEGK